jgi:hypothetical protein
MLLDGTRRFFREIRVFTSFVGVPVASHAERQAISGLKLVTLQYMDLHLDRTGSVTVDRIALWRTSLV